MLIRCLLLLAGIASAAPLDPFAGRFRGADIKLALERDGESYKGTITAQGSPFAVVVAKSGTGATGSFEAGGKTYTFALHPAGNGLKLVTEGTTFLLEREAAEAAPAPQATTTKAEPGSIVGMWRNATGYARFNADGTGLVDGVSGRYQFSNGQLAMSSAQDSLTVPAQVNGDVLTLTVNNQQVVLNRSNETPGAAGVRTELVGKWCWLSSLSSSSHTASSSSRCFTLTANGTYTYYGESGSYNPNGSVASQSGDSGTWTATDTSIIAISRSRGRQVYQLEKRNHPKTKDAMIVLDGQPYVTFFNRPRW